jgi:CheY-like chemotaxis protein
MFCRSWLPNTSMLVVLDKEMPGGSGFELLPQLRRRYLGSNHRDPREATSRPRTALLVRTADLYEGALGSTAGQPVRGFVPASAEMTAPRRRDAALETWRCRASAKKACSLGDFAHPELGNEVARLSSCAALGPRCAREPDS